MAIARWTAVPALWDRWAERCCLVQRIRSKPKHPGPFRFENGEIPDLADPFRRRRCAQYDGDTRRQPRHGLQWPESGRTRGNKMILPSRKTKPGNLPMFNVQLSFAEGDFCSLPQMTN